MQLVLHEYPPSGNCYKIRLTAAHLGLPLERRTYDIMKGETRTPDYLQRVNGDGRVPVLEVDGRMLPESNAACLFLAEGSRLIPDDRWERGQMMRWLFWEQYGHEPNIATLRFWLGWVGLEALTEAQRLQMAPKRVAGTAALQLMDRHLKAKRWFAGEGMSVADIALFAYTHVADEADFDLELYPHVIRWMEQVMDQPGHVGLDA